jgi:hypothetical protein
MLHHDALAGARGQNSLERLAEITSMRSQVLAVVIFALISFGPIEKASAATKVRQAVEHSLTVPDFERTGAYRMKIPRIS